MPTIAEIPRSLELSEVLTVSLVFVDALEHLLMITPSISEKHVATGPSKLFQLASFLLNIRAGDNIPIAAAFSH